MEEHQDAVFWVDIVLAIKKGLIFYQTRSNAIILQGTLPTYCIPKVERLKTGEVLCEKVYMSPRPLPKISSKHEWNRELGSEHAQRPGFGQLSRSYQSNQPTLNPIRERSERLDVTHNVQDGRKTSRSKYVHLKTVRISMLNRHMSERGDFSSRITYLMSDSSQTRCFHESEKFNVDDEILRKRTERSVAHHDVSHESMMVKEANMDFRIPGVPHSLVKYTQSTSVRELIQKIENHPN